MGRPKKQIEVPGQSAETTNDAAGDALLLNSVANTPAQLNAATAGATVITETTVTDGQQGENVEGNDLQARNVALSGLNAAAFQIITKFEAYGFVDEVGHPLTNNLDFIDLVKQATTQTTSTAVINEDGQRKQHKAPVLTDKGWHVPG